MFFRMNIRRSKGLIWTLNLLAILSITALFFFIYKKKASGKFQPQDPALFKQHLDRGISNENRESGDLKIDINNYSAIWKASIDGVKKKEPLVDEGDKPPVETTVTPIQDVVQVVAILKAKNPDQSQDSLVRLAYLDPEVNMDTAFTLDIWSREGEQLKPPYDVHPYYAKVLRIEADRVLFSYNEEEVFLTPDFVTPKEETAKGLIDPNLPSDIAEMYTHPPEETVEYNNHVFFSPKESNHLATNWSQELELVSLDSRKNPSTGKSALVVSAVAESSLAAKRGFVKGDVLISINGFPVHNKAGAINYFKEHPEEGQYTVEYERHGKRSSKTFIVPKD